MSFNSSVSSLYMTDEKTIDLRLDHIGHHKPIPLNAMESGRTDRDSDLGDDSPMVSLCSLNFTLQNIIKRLNGYRHTIR